MAWVSPNDVLIHHGQAGSSVYTIHSDGTGLTPFSSLASPWTKSDAVDGADWPPCLSPDRSLAAVSLQSSIFVVATDGNTSTLIYQAPKSAWVTMPVTAATNIPAT